MQPHTVSALGVPPTPATPIRSYYRYPVPNDNLWLYYDGERWLGEPQTLQWFRRPLGWARGRAPVWALLVIFGVIGAGVVLMVVPWR